MAARKKRSSPNVDLGNLYRSIESAFDIADTKVKVLVFGPAFDEDGAGSRLRKHIVEECRREQFVVVLAEHQEIQDLYSKLLGPVHDLCKMEWHLATEKDRRSGHDIIDGIIILPDSAGSFVELGMFVIEEPDVHSKMLILFNKGFESTITDSFIGKGAKAAFDNGRALTRMIDYGDLHNSWDEVRAFLQLIKSWRTWRMVRRNRVLSNVQQ